MLASVYILYYLKDLMFVRPTAFQKQSQGCLPILLQFVHGFPLEQRILTLRQRLLHNHKE